MSRAKAVAAGKKAAATRKKHAKNKKKQVLGFYKKNGKTIPITKSSKHRSKRKIAASKKAFNVKPKSKAKKTDTVEDKVKHVGSLIVDGVVKAAKVAVAVVKDGVEAVVYVGKETEEKAEEVGEEVAKDAALAAVVA